MTVTLMRNSSGGTTICRYSKDDCIRHIYDSIDYGVIYASDKSQLNYILKAGQTIKIYLNVSKTPIPYYSGRKVLASVTLQPIKK